MATEPLAGKRIAKVTERKTKIDWAQFLADIAACYEDADRSAGAGGGGHPARACRRLWRDTSPLGPAAQGRGRAVELPHRRARRAHGAMRPLRKRPQPFARAS